MGIVEPFRLLVLRTASRSSRLLGAVVARNVETSRWGMAELMRADARHARSPIVTHPIIIRSHCVERQQTCHIEICDGITKIMS